MKISERLAATEPHLTFEFLSECFVGFKNSTTNLKHLCLEYMAPWLSNLTYLSRSIDQDGKGSQAKTKQLLSMMFDLTVKEVDMAPSIQSKIWRTIAQVDDLIDLVLDTIVLYAVEHGVGSVQAETLADTIVTLSAVNVRAGKLISRLRKLISKTAVVPKRNLTDHASWPEVAVLVRFNLMLSFNNRFIAQHYLPELFHIISILVATDHPIIRTSVHGLVINVIQSLCTCLPPNSPNLKTLSILLAEFSEPKFRLLFGLNRNMVNTVSRANEGSMDTHDLMPLNSLETIVHTLLDVMSYGSTSIDQSNIWRARWMSLVTSTAFQFNPAVQPRAFIVLGCLARGEVDDDLLYQILIALRGALELFDDTDCSLIVSIVLCLSNIAENLPGDSIYLQPMFWLGTAFIQIGHRPLFPSAIGLIEVVINKMRSHGLFTNTDLGAVLMKAREPFHQVSDQLDSCTGVKFAVDFPFALSTLLLKGLKHSATKTATQNVFTTLLDISTKSAPRQSHMSPQVLGFLSPMLPTAAKNLELKELLQSVGLDDVPVDNSELTRTYHKIFDRLGVADRTKALLLVSQMVGILQHAEFEAEILFLYGFFAEVAQTMPDIFVMVQDRLVPKMNQVLNSNQTAAIIDAVQSILYTVISNPYFQTRAAKPRNVSNILTELGFSTLLDCATWPDYPKDKLLRNAKLVSMLVESIVG
jgi:neurofibromin 1